MRRTYVKACISIATFVACCAYSFALDPSHDVSQYGHKSWNNRDGFPKDIIHAIVQTPDGYLWLGTEFGLVRFDGVRAVPWQPPADQHLPSNKIQSLLVARDGTLWIGTWKGLASWNGRKLTLYPELAEEVIFPLIEDQEGVVWAGGFAYNPPGKLCKIQSGVVKCYGEDGSLGNGVLGLYEDRNRTLWVGTRSGLWRWKPGPQKFYPIEGEPSGIQALTEDTGAGLLVALHGRIARLANGKLQTAYSYPAPARQTFARTRLRDRDGGLWFGTMDHGLVHVHQGKTDGFAQTEGLSGDTVTALFEDREGNVWVATSNGLDRFRDLAGVTYSANQGFPNFGGSVLAARDGSIWVSSFDGLSRSTQGQVTFFQGPGIRGPQRPSVQEVVIDGLPTSEWATLFQDHDGRIWVAGAGGIGYLENRRFISICGARGGIVYAMAEDSARNIWIANLDHGLLQLSGDRVVRQIPWTRLGHKELGMTLAIDPLQGGVWLGFYQGGLAYWKDGQVRATYTSAEGLGEGSISNLRVDAEGVLWAATEGGLSRLKNGHAITLSSKNGLPCNQVQWSIEDNDRSLWLSMACGLVRISRSEVRTWEGEPNRSIQVTVFDSSDGMRSHVSVPMANPKVGKSPDGKIWFTTGNGITMVNPRHLPFNNLPPPVHVEQVTVDGKTHDPSRDLRLPPLLQDLTIDYTALSFVSPEKVLFRYKLEGWDHDWQEAGNRRQAIYTNLPPRNYRFRVVACNNSGVWNEKGATLDFAIPPAYYQTNWFRTLCLLTFGAMIWTIYRLRVRVVERRHELLEQSQALLEQHQVEIRALNEQMVKAQEAERMRISGELHDGILQQITSLTLRLAKVRNQVPPDSEAKTTVSALQQQLIKIGADIRHISHELHPALLQDSGLPQALSAYCEEFSKVRGLPVTCEADPSVEELFSGSALCLYRIAQEALGNAAKHSRARKVEVRLSRGDGSVRLSVTDDGVGCDPTTIGKTGGLGVINMRERVLQLNGTFEFDSALGRGTMVRAEVPFQPATKSLGRRTANEDVL